MYPTQPFKLSSADIEAILAALPIAENFPAESHDQIFRNRMCAQAARQKLLTGRNNFTSNELRVIAVSVCYAAEFLSGRMPQLEKLVPDTSVIQRFALSYVRLNNHFRPQLDALVE